METISLIINKLLDFKDIIFCFGCEIALLAGFLLNILLIPLKNKINIAKASAFITITIFILNIIGIAVIYFGNFINFDSYSFSLWADYFEPNSQIFTLKALINLFMLFFVVTNLKNIKKFRFRTPILHSIVMLLAVAGCLISQVGNYFLAYLLIEATSILTYKFASNMRIKKYSMYSTDFIILSTIGTFVFALSCFLGLEAVKPAQISIINICLSVAVLMKIGLSPVYNFLIVKQARSNIAFAVLLYCYLPWVGVIAFNKMSNIIMPSDEIYQIPMLVFVMFSLAAFAFYASKHKNTVKFLANFSYFVNALCILSVIYFQSNYNSIRLSTLYAFLMLSIYSLINIAKDGLRLKKINFANLRGAFLNNRMFAFLISFLLIMMTGLIPCGIMKGILKILKDIYIYDKTGFLTVCAVSIFMILILSNVLKAVQEIYLFNKNNIAPKFAKFTKGTALNYAVPFIVLIFLLISLFL